MQMENNFNLWKRKKKEKKKKRNLQALDVLYVEGKNKLMVQDLQWKGMWWKV